jgi:hypothetical protein
MQRGLRLASAIVALQAVALVLAHELTYLARYGSSYNEALVHAGHGEAWSAAVITSALIALGLAALAAGRLLRVRSELRAFASPVASPRAVPFAAMPVSHPSTAALLRAWLRIGIPMAVSTTVLLTVQENLERLATPGADPQLLLLQSPEYAGGLWIAALTGVLVALVAALFRWGYGRLVARLRVLRERIRRQHVARARRTGLALPMPASSIIGTRAALRAPPAMLQV